MFDQIENGFLVALTAFCLLIFCFLTVAFAKSRTGIGWGPAITYAAIALGAFVRLASELYSIVLGLEINLYTQKVTMTIWTLCAIGGVVTYYTFFIKHRTPTTHEHDA